MKFDQTRYAYLALLESLQNLLTIRQTHGQTVNDYSRDLINASKTIEHYGGTIVLNPNLSSKYDTAEKKRTQAKCKEATKDELLALLLLHSLLLPTQGTLKYARTCAIRCLIKSDCSFL